MIKNLKNIYLNLGVKKSVYLDNYKKDNDYLLFR